MKLYDEIITDVNSLFKTSLTQLNIKEDVQDEKEKVFIFSSDSIVNLGSSLLPSSYLMGYTSSSSLVSKDEIFLLGKDIKDLKGDVPFSHISFFLIDETDLKDQEIYRILRNIEYSRYKVNPKGYMLKIHTGFLKEGGKISKDAFDSNLSFSDVGSLFLKHYKKEPRVKAVKQIFITDSNFDYDSIFKFSKLSEGITVTLDHIKKNLKMDCRTCSFKEICDTVEGMRELHQKENSN